jgi:ATP-dependent Clp protease ATP-binding subunit ClpB
MPQFNRFTIKAQEALQNAQDLAQRENHGEMKALHLLASLTADPTTLIHPILIRSGVKLESLEAQTEEALKTLPKIVSNSSVGSFIFQMK